EVFKFSKLRLGEQANNSLRVAFVSSATGRAGYASRQRRFYQGTTTSSCEAAAERRRSRPCWRARASGARRLARDPRSAERAVAPQAGCVRQTAPRRSQRLSIDDAGRHGDVELASEPLELHMLEACLAEGRRLRR